MGKLRTRLVTYPDPILLQVAKPVKEFNNKKLYELRDLMIKTMLAEKGVGLAAPQVGHSIRMVVIDETMEVRCLINPKIINHSTDVAWSEERCLSCPGISKRVLRFVSVTVEFQTLSGRKTQKEYTDFQSYIIQHEIDHTLGILLIDYE